MTVFENACKIKKQILKLREKQNKIAMDNLKRYKDGSASRSKTTTANARRTWINIEIERLEKSLYQ